MAGYFGECTCELNAGGARADHHERQPLAPKRVVGFALGVLKGEQYAAAYGESVFQGFQPRRVRRPRVVAKVAVGRTGCDDEIVVGDVCCAIQAYVTLCGVDGGDFAHQHGDVLLPAKNMAYRRGDGRPGQACGGHLIQQRLKQMMVTAVDQRDLHGLAGECLGRFKSAEAAADDDDVRTILRRHANILTQVR